jgi:putative transposase
MSADPREAIALFRYAVINAATNPRLTPAERGQLVRELASQAHLHPDGAEWTYTRGTLDRWIRAYREQGLDGLRPPPRADLGTVRRHPELLEEACQLRLELPARSAAQIASILKLRHGIFVPERTIRQHLRRRGLHRAALAGQPRAFGRYEAERPNERWMGDVLVGPFVPYPRVAGSKRAFLWVLVDDYSRLLVHGRWLPDQNTRAGQDVLRAALQRRGVPEQLLVDNGAPYSHAALQRSCAVLGIRLLHSRPYKPQSRGKQERLLRYIRERFLLEAEAHGIASFAELNDRFTAWAEQVCNTRVHAETGQTPIQRFTSQGQLRAVEPSLLREAFRWSVLRRVTSTASVSLAGNRYSVDEALIGRRVELRFDPEDLTRLEVYWEGHPAGQAIPFILGRHVHRQVPQAQPPNPPPPIGVDYLGIVLAAHDAETLGQLAFRDLPVQPRVDGQPQPDFSEGHLVEHQPQEDHQTELPWIDEDDHHLVGNLADDDHSWTQAQPDEDHSA